MRELGEKPSTGAQKQKRHREGVKARLAEAVALKARAESDPGGSPGLKTFCHGLLRALGASAHEAQRLSDAAASLQHDSAVILRAGGRRSTRCAASGPTMPPA
jgi:hypothetical protein